MATPNPGTNSTLVDADLMRHYVHAGDHTGATKQLWGAIRYTGTVWTVDGSYSSNEITDSDLTYDIDHLVISLQAGYATAKWPVAVVSPLGQTAFIPKSLTINAQTIHIFFENGAGVAQTLESSNMSFSFIIMGE